MQKPAQPTPALFQLSEALAASAALVGGVFALALSLGLGVLSVVLSLHHYANVALLSDFNVTGTYSFLYFFPWLVRYTIPWAPPWAPICLWYCFLVQLFCTVGTGAEAKSKSHLRMISIARVVVPAMFLVEGVSYHSFLLDLSGGELLTVAYVLATLRSAKVTNIVFVFTFAFQILVCVFFGRSLVGHWIQVATGLVSVMTIQACARKAAAQQHLQQQQQARSAKGNRVRDMIQQIQPGNRNINSMATTSKNLSHQMNNNARQREQQEKMFQEYQRRQQRHFFQVRVQLERLKEEEEEEEEEEERIK